MQRSTWIKMMAAGCASALLVVGGLAQAGGGGSGPDLLRVFTEKPLLDRPDLLNFDPFKRSGGNTYAADYVFTAMYETYTTTFPSYSAYGPSYTERNCFNDPDDKKMVEDNILCIRAGARRVSATDASYLVYQNLTDTFGTWVYYGPLEQQASALFGQKVYAYGGARVLTELGGEVEVQYEAEIPDKLKRNRKKVKFTQSAWVDVSGDVWGPVGESFDYLGGFAGWFEGCEWSGGAKGDAFEDGKSSDGMVPIAKQGTLKIGRAHV